jgi:hypothetical protein
MFTTTGPKPLLHKTYRDVDYDVEKIRGSSIEFNEETGDALWKLSLRKLVPDKQFIHINVRRECCVRPTHTHARSKSLPFYLPLPPLLCAFSRCSTFFNVTAMIGACHHTT